MPLDCSDGESSSALCSGSFDTQLIMQLSGQRAAHNGPHCGLVSCMHSWWELEEVFCLCLQEWSVTSYCSLILDVWSKSCSTMSAESMGVKDRERYMSPETSRHKDKKFLLEAMILSQASMKVEYQGWSQHLSFTVSVHPISRKKLHCKFLGGSLFCAASWLAAACANQRLWECIRLQDVRMGDAPRSGASLSSLFLTSTCQNWVASEIDLV